jgi:hypothetical protein
MTCAPWQVGDPQQLPATVLSPVVARLEGGRSMMARLLAADPGAAHLLDTQVMSRAPLPLQCHSS